MTGLHAYAFALALMTGLLVLVLPASLVLMGVPAGVMRDGLRAGAIATAVALLAAGAIGVILFVGPLRGVADRPADNLVILAAIAAALSVMLAGIGAMVIHVYRRAGLLADDQLRGTVMAMVGCWVLAVAMFTWAVLA